MGSELERTLQRGKMIQGYLDALAVGGGPVPHLVRVPRIPRRILYCQITQRQLKFVFFLYMCISLERSGLQECLQCSSSLRVILSLAQWHLGRIGGCQQDYAVLSDFELLFHFSSCSAVPGILTFVFWYEDH